MGTWGHAAFEMVPGCGMLIAITADPAATSPFEGCPTLGQIMAASAPLNEPAPTNPDDTAIIIYTSGTTGDPKGAELTHSNVMMNTFLLRDLMQYQPTDVSLLVLPLFHVFGLIVQMSSGILAGITHVIQPRFDPKPCCRPWRGKMSASSAARRPCIGRCCITTARPRRTRSASAATCAAASPPASPCRDRR